MALSVMVDSRTRKSVLQFLERMNGHFKALAGKSNERSFDTKLATLASAKTMHYGWSCFLKDSVMFEPFKLLGEYDDDHASLSYDDHASLSFDDDDRMFLSVYGEVGLSGSFRDEDKEVDHDAIDADSQVHVETDI